MIPKSHEDALVAMKSCAQLTGDRFDLTAFAIASAIHENPNREIGPALDVLKHVTALARERQPASAQAFARLMFADLGFGGVHGGYDDPCNADMIDILINRQGLPIGLGHIWRHAARAISAPLYGTDMPGHFIMRFEAMGPEVPSKPVFLDPFDGGAILSEGDIAQIANRAGHSKLSETMLRPVGDRVMALRLQTNLVARARERGDIEAWVRAAQRRAILAPDNFSIAMDYSKAAEAAGLMNIALHWSEIANGLSNLSASVQEGSNGNRSQALRHKLN
jgi:regulator of sirC expression with transglutaminase-like and TPR domain